MVLSNSKKRDSITVSLGRVFHRLARIRKSGTRALVFLAIFSIIYSYLFLYSPIQKHTDPVDGSQISATSDKELLQEQSKELSNYELELIQARLEFKSLLSRSSSPSTSSSSSSASKAAAGNSDKSLDDTKKFWVAQKGIMLMCVGISHYTTAADCVLDAVQTANMISLTGCELPVAVAYDDREFSELEIDYLNHFNITPVLISRYLERSSAPAENLNVVLIGSSIIAAPFDEVLFLHPRSYALKNPTDLFYSEAYIQNDAVFWQNMYRDDNSTVSDAQMTYSRQIKELLQVEEHDREDCDHEIAIDTFIINKLKAKKPLAVLRFIVDNAISLKYPSFATHSSLGQASCILHSAFSGPDTKIYEVTRLPFLVGAFTKPETPRGNNEMSNEVESLIEGSTRQFKFCGQAFGFAGLPKFITQDSTDTESNIFFINWFDIGGHYEKSFDYFQAAVSLTLPDPQFVPLKMVDRIRDLSKCRVLDKEFASGANLSVNSLALNTSFPSLNKRFKGAREYARNINLIHKLKARRFKLTVLSYENSIQPDFAYSSPSLPSIKFAKHIKSGTKGVVYTGTGSHAHNVIMSVLLLRETGCVLPVEFVYVAGQVHPVDLDWIRSFNITPVDMSPFLVDYNHKWSKGEWRLGCGKVFSILASSFEEVLFMDPDNFALQDPTFLFDTKMYRKYGSIFWPDYPLRKRGIAMWEVFDMQDRFWNELEFESGQIVINKRASWRGLIMTMHLNVEAKYYFKHFLGDKETFFWGYAYSETPYFLVPTYIHNVGLVVNEENPKGNTLIGVDFQTTKFCGQSMMQSDFDDNGDISIPTKPLFMHWNMLKRQYNPEFNYFQSAMTYEFPSGKSAADYADVNYYYVGNFLGLENCLILKNVGGVKIKLWDWQALNPGFNERFHRAYDFKPTLSDLYQYRWGNAIKKIPAYSTTVSNVKKSGNRGIVMIGINDEMHVLVRTILTIRQSGCELPIEVFYDREQTIPSQIELIRVLGATPVDFSDEVTKPEWNSDRDYKKATKLIALLNSSYENVLFIDTSLDTFWLRNPEYLFDTKVFASVGGLFWQNFIARDPHNTLWKTFKLQNSDYDRKEMRFDSGVFVINKKRAWNALQLAHHFFSDGHFYLDHFQGAIDFLFWSFAATKTPYFLNPHFFSIAGLVVNKDFPFGKGKQSLPPTPPVTTFCGTSLIYSDFKEVDASDNFQPSPLFLRMESQPDPVMSENNVDFFQSIMSYYKLQGNDGNNPYGFWMAEKSVAEFVTDSKQEDGSILSLRKCFSFSLKGNKVNYDLGVMITAHNLDIVKSYWGIYNRVK